jgi:hypothetical protein
MSPNTKSRKRGLPLAARLLFGFLVIAPMMSGCADCEPPCEDFFSISWEKQSSWAPGEYEIELEFDNNTVMCGFTVTSTKSISHLCDDPRTSGGANGVIHRNAPSHVAVVLYMDGEVIIAQEFDPDYETPPEWRPVCGPACDHSKSNPVVVP